MTAIELTGLPPPTAVPADGMHFSRLFKESPQFFTKSFTMQKLDNIYLRLKVSSSSYLSYLRLLGRLTANITMTMECNNRGAMVWTLKALSKRCAKSVSRDLATRVAIKLRAAKCRERPQGV